MKRRTLQEEDRYVSSCGWRLYVDIPRPNKDNPIITPVLNDLDSILEQQQQQQPDSNDDGTTVAATAATTTTLPWSQVQDWALRDNVPKYLIRITMKDDSTSSDASTASSANAVKDDATTTTTTLQTFCLWRSLLQDVPELAGYPVDFLQQKYQQQPTKKKNKDDDDDDTLPNQLSSPIVGILPYLQDYEFTADGGVCGTVYGLDGVADGSRITTSPLNLVQQTIPNGYVQTQDKDGRIAYELGLPIGSSSTRTATAATASAASNMLQQSVINLKDGGGGGDDSSNGGGGDLLPGDDLLIRLGATTGIVLAGAAALNMLSHHMTVNVFWV